MLYWSRFRHWLRVCVSVCMQVCVREICACLVTQALQCKTARILISVPHQARTRKTNMAEDSENKDSTRI